MQALLLQIIHLGPASQLEPLALVGGPHPAPLTAISGLQRLTLYGTEGNKQSIVLKQLAALAPHARQLTALTLADCELLTVTCELVELANSLRLLPELRELEVRQVSDVRVEQVLLCTRQVNQGT